MTAGRAKRRPHSISCTQLEWEQIRALAHEADMGLSEYIVDRALTADPDAEEPVAPDGDGAWLVLTETQQVELIDTGAHLVKALLGDGTGSGGIAGGMEMTAVLVRLKQAEMIRAGRAREMNAAMEAVLAERRARERADGGVDD